MHFEDRILARLASPLGRAGLFDAQSGARLRRVLLGAQPAGDATLTIDRIQLGVPLETSQRSRIQVQITEAPWRALAEIVIEPTPSGKHQAIDAVVWGHISLALPTVLAPIETVTTRTRPWPTLARIDAGLPAGLSSEKREARRRLALSQLLDAGPSTDEERLASMDRLLVSTGMETVAQFLDRSAGDAAVAGLRLRFAADEEGAAAPAAEPVPFTAAVVIEGFPTDAATWRDVLKRVRDAQRAVRDSGQATADIKGVVPRERVPVLLFAPAKLFDDLEWPGAIAGATSGEQRQQREEMAASWLAESGIVLVTVGDPGG